jgi:DNA-binding HxlR family transcriptional regulator
MAKRKETSTNNINRETLNRFCGMNYALDILGGRWKLLILYKLEKGPLRFSTLKQQLPNVTDRMLSLHLQELEEQGLITRTVFAEVPPRVEYTLTDISRKLAPIWKELELWGHEHKAMTDEDVPAKESKSAERS